MYWLVGLLGLLFVGWIWFVSRRAKEFFDSCSDDFFGPPYLF